jgi:hypothetical protein
MVRSGKNDELDFVKQSTSIVGMNRTVLYQHLKRQTRIHNSITWDYTCLSRSYNTKSAHHIPTRMSAVSRAEMLAEETHDGCPSQAERHNATKDNETHQELPTVFEPFCSARRRYCAALNCKTSASQHTWLAENPIGENDVCK